MGAIYGYAFAEPHAQNPVKKRAELIAFGVQSQNTFIDSPSDLETNRVEYEKLLDILKPGDVLVIGSVTDLGENLEYIASEWQTITHTLGATLVILDMPMLDTHEKSCTAPAEKASDIFLGVVSYLAKMQQSSARKRQAEGIASAQERGVRFGRPEKKRPRAYGTVRKACLTGKITRKEAAKRLEVSVGTLNKWFKEDAEKSI